MAAGLGRTGRHVPSGEREEEKEKTKPEKGRVERKARSN